ncbi:glycogen synthase [Endomicrobium proavitum]|uniref:Glycogen synthase n=1 Tax=Endomicrobium proavitum TaxID=1408281 RepID=A0A0G3WI06_9BACT|nr:glycogen/starch synthase [Endomicrobium proavitum]AKL97510.1 Glycogen synthase [Endomicrobium proavitum]
MKILMAASECAPFVKVGGLADVLGTLPAYLKKAGHDVRVIIPKYKAIDEKKYDLKPAAQGLSVKVSGDEELFAVKQCVTKDGVKVYFVESRRFFDRNGVYGEGGYEYGDSRERYIFFCRAVFESLKAVNFIPDVIHCHDWQTGLIPAYLKTVLKNDDYFSKTSSVFTIHNIAYQGSFPADTVVAAGFSWEDFTVDKLEFYDTVNFMKCGIQLADAVSTVSPTYALEIQDFNGKGMSVVLNSRKDKIYGILNGIDYDYWNPETDKNIISNFSKYDTSGKSFCKADLQELCGFEVKEDAYLFGCVSRLDNQKGFDIITDALYHLKDKNMQFVILGSGDPSIKRALEDAVRNMPKKAAAFFEYNEALAHKIYAGADAYMMPSRFEPCGLSQMIALAYGAIPVVNRTGGLSDTIVYYNHYTHEGNGFVFNITYGENFVETILKSEKIFRDKASWSPLMQNAFNSNFSWDNSVIEYIKMYKNILKAKR